LYKENGLGPNTKINLEGEYHNWEIGNLRTKKKENRLSFKKKERRPMVFNRGEGEVLNL
jgi:hypothetical protein